MLKITLEPEVEVLECEPGSTLVELSEEQELGILFGCRKGACGSCLISVDPNSNGFLPAKEIEQQFLRKLQATPHQRLACQCVLVCDTKMSSNPEHCFEERPSGDLPNGVPINSTAKTKNSNSDKPVILLLSHRGFSFIDDLITIAQKLGLRACVLMSQPTKKTIFRVEEVRSHADWFKLASAPSLSLQDILNAIEDLRSTHSQIIGCMSVWEGYRVLAAEINKILGLSDESPERIRSVLDKYRMRRLLLDAGLSSASTTVVTPQNLDSLKNGAKSKFIKPRRGLASFGAFRLTSELQFNDLERLILEMRMDEDYSDIFSGLGSQFVAEDQIPGTEFSFEVIAFEGVCYTIAIHEKVEMEEMGATTLESACISPPAHIAKKSLERGNKFVRECFSALGLSTGCFHVELKWDRSTDSWEIIEINPRVGGAFINQSVLEQNSGVGLLELWMRVLLEKFSNRSKVFHEYLQTITWDVRELSEASRETFFRVYFGTPGLKLSKLEKADGVLSPALIRFAAQPGDVLPHSSREIFLAQALWVGRSGELKNQLDLLIKESKDSIRIEYSETDPLASANEIELTSGLKPA